VLSFDEASLFSIQPVSATPSVLRTGRAKKPRLILRTSSACAARPAGATCRRRYHSYAAILELGGNPRHQNQTEGIGPFFLLCLQPQNTARANPQQVHPSSGSLHTTSARNKPRSSTQARTLSQVSATVQSVSPKAVVTRAAEMVYDDGDILGF
jgi:hypothetical protein